MKPIKIIAATAEEASRIYLEKQDATGEGASTFPDGTWNGKHISYNGRVWDSADDWRTGVRPVYCPGQGYRKEEAK